MAAVARTPCPRCQAAVPVRGERGSCPGCGLAVRFVDATEAPCSGCGKPVAFAPGAEAARCLRCSAWTATDPARRVEGRATCPRCRRRIEVPATGERAACPHCGTGLLLADTL